MDEKARWLKIVKEGDREVTVDLVEEWFGGDGGGQTDELDSEKVESYCVVAVV